MTRSRCWISHIFAIFLLVFCWQRVARGELVAELESTLRPSVLGGQEQANAQFGSAVAMWGDIAVVGAPGEYDPALGSAAAYVYRYTNDLWFREARLEHHDNYNRGDHFGGAVAVHGNTIVVGSPEGWNTDSWLYTDDSSAYVFVKEGGQWHQQARLMPSTTRTAFGGFGEAVSIWGDTVVVGDYGASFFDGTGYVSGAVYIYERDGTNWSEQAKLYEPSYAYDERRFGYAVVQESNRLLVSAYDVGDIATQTNASGLIYGYVYDGTNWMLESSFRGTDVAPMGQKFGSSLALDGDTLLTRDGRGYLSGTNVYVFRRSGGVWEQEAKIVTQSVALSISGDLALIGDPNDDNLRQNVGCTRIYVREGTNWAFRGKGYRPDGVAGDRYGSAVALSGTRNQRRCTA